jgi:hypothetical protein
MASSHAATHYTPLLADPRSSFDSTAEDYNHVSEDATPTAIYGLVLGTTSATRPFATSFHPTLFNRALSLLLLIPAFIILVSVDGAHFAATIVFLSFAIARQVVVLSRHWGGHLVKVHIEIVHPSWKTQERWIMRTVSGAVDGIILIGLLVTLALGAREVAVTSRGLPAVTAAVVLGFIAL